MSKCKVSVIVAAYNAEGFLLRAVNSVLSQTVQDFEILLVDDASTDQTRDLMERLSLEDKRIKTLFLTENGGPSIARNKAIESSEGDWLAVLDADDVYLPDRLGRLVEVAERENADVILDNFLWYDAKRDAIERSGLRERSGQELVDLERYSANTLPFKRDADWGLLKPMWRRDFLVKSGIRYPAHVRHGEDYLMMVSMLLGGARCVLFKEAGYVYTKSNSGWQRTQQNYVALLDETLKLLKRQNVLGCPSVVENLYRRLFLILQMRVEHQYISTLKQMDIKKAAASILDNPWLVFRTIALVVRFVKNRLSSLI